MITPLTTDLEYLHTQSQDAEAEAAAPVVVAFEMSIPEKKQSNPG